MSFIVAQRGDRVWHQGYVWTVIGERTPHDVDRGASNRECQIQIHDTRKWVHADRLEVAARASRETEATG